VKYQSQKSSCGPAALSAALEAIGIERAESEMITLTGCSADGTHDEDMVRALRIVQQSEPAIAARPFQDNADVAILRLLRALDDGHPVIVAVCVDRPWDHYAVVVGRLGTGATIRLNVFDAGTSESFRSMSMSEFMPWWRGPKTERKPYYGIIV
jgi:ABC-type bacteriocin/lantibiotic exporter with double-glycine peptidase domain